MLGTDGIRIDFVKNNEDCKGMHFTVGKRHFQSVMLLVTLLGCLSTAQHPIECMPPRQHKSSSSSSAPSLKPGARRTGPSPLNEGFAVPIEPVKGPSVLNAAPPAA